MQIAQIDNYEKTISNDMNCRVDIFVHSFFGKFKTLMVEFSRIISHGREYSMELTFHCNSLSENYFHVHVSSALNP